MIDWVVVGVFALCVFMLFGIGVLVFAIVTGLYSLIKSRGPLTWWPW